MLFFKKNRQKIRQKIRQNQGEVSETESIAMDILGLLDDEQSSDKPIEETLHKIHFGIDNLCPWFLIRKGIWYMPNCRIYEYYIIFIYF